MQNAGQKQTRHHTSDVSQRACIRPNIIYKRRVSSGVYTFDTTTHNRDNSSDNNDVSINTNKNNTTNNNVATNST